MHILQNATIQLQYVRMCLIGGWKKLEAVRSILEFVVNVGMLRNVTPPVAPSAVPGPDRNSASGAAAACTIFSVVRISC